VKNWLAIIAIAFTLFASAYGAIKVFATNERVDLVQLRLDQKIVADQAWYLQQQIAQLEDRYYDSTCKAVRPISSWTLHDRTRYRKLMFDLSQLQK